MHATRHLTGTAEEKQECNKNSPYLTHENVSGKGKIFSAITF